MKKIFALFLCAMLVCATPIIAHAEGEISEPVEVTEEMTVPEKIVNFVKDNYEGSSYISLVLTIIGYTIYEVRKHKALNGSIGVLNNNAVSVAKDSAKAVGDAIAKAEDLVKIVGGYKEAFDAVLSELRKNAEEKQSLEDMLLSARKSLEVSKLALMELANEVAELLVLANIPNAKKEELYSRHRAVVKAIETAENTEVIIHDGKEA